MDYRTLGKTGLKVSTLGFGCGAVGGLMVRGERSDMLQVVERAVELGVTYFDTASMYGRGKSEENLGWVLRELKPDIVLGTKVQLMADDMDDIRGAVIQSVEDSLKRLQLEQVDLIQLHNVVAAERNPERNWVTVDDVNEAIAAFADLQRQGKVGHYGINGIGETDAILAALDTGTQTFQCCYNLLNPSAGGGVPPDFPYQNYGQMIEKAYSRDIGVIAIRVLAGGALSGSLQRHPNAAQDVGPIGSGESLADDVSAAQHFQFLVDDGFADSLVEAAIRFVVSNDSVATAMVGISNMEQLETAVAAAEKGALPPAATDTLQGVWARL